MAIQKGEVSCHHYIHGYHADIFYSAFIRDLITFPSDQALESSPIELEHNNKIVRYFIDFVMSGSTSTAQISMTDFEELFKLSDKFMAEKVEKSLIVAMGLRVQQRPTPEDLEPWTVFRFASNRDNVELARACILAFECAEIDRHDIFNAEASKFDGIAGKYIAGLLLAGFDMTRHLNPRGVGPDIVVKMRTWKEVAENFSVE